jgi:hypothetical protein
MTIKEKIADLLEYWKAIFICVLITGILTFVGYAIKTTLFQ